MDGPDAEKAPEFAAFVEEYKGLLNRPDLVIKVSAADAYWIMAALQLAWRHPTMGDTVKDAVWRTGHQLMEGLHLDGALLKTAEAGWDPAQDR